MNGKKFLCNNKSNLLCLIIYICLYPSFNFVYFLLFRTVEEYDRKRDLFLSKKKKKKEEKNKKKREQISRQHRARYVDDLEDNSDSIET